MSSFLPPKKPIDVFHASVEKVFADTKYIVAKEVERIKEKAMNNVALTQQDTLNLKAVVSVFTSVVQEERAQEVHKRADQLTNDQLEELVCAMVKQSPKLLSIVRGQLALEAKQNDRDDA